MNLTMDIEKQMPNKEIVSVKGRSLESRFPIGAPVQIEAKEKKYSSIFLGVNAPDYLLLELPIVNGKYIQFDYNTMFTIRFFSDGSAYGFNSFPIRLHGKTGVLVMEYPEAISKYDFRDGSRLHVLIPAKIRIENVDEKIDGAILDLSPKGALLATNLLDNVQKGQRLKTSLVLPNGRPIKPVQGVICNVKQSFGKTLLGVNFEGHDKQFITSVGDFYQNCFSYLADRDDLIQTQKVGMFDVGQEITLEFSKKKVTAILRGWKLGDNARIIFECPALDLIANTLNPKFEVIIRLVRAGILYGFTARLRSHLEKSKLWLFSVNEDIMEFPLRSDDRFYCLAPVKIYTHERDKYIEIGEGMIFNLSLSGTKLLTKHLLPEDEYFWISLFLDQWGTVKYQKMKVVRNSSHGVYFEYAGTFVNFRKENKERLVSFLEFCKNWYFEK